VRRPGEPLGTRCEIKNLNSFRFLEHAIEFEVRRQIGILEDGGAIEQETRLYDPEKNETRSMRTKEEAHDYRYFPDPDLLPLVITAEMIEEIRAKMPKSLQERSNEYEEKLKLSKQDAALLTASHDVARYFDDIYKATDSVFPAALYLTEAPELAKAKSVANWVINEVGSRLNRDHISISHSPVSADQLAHLIARIFDGTISNKMAKEVLDAMWAGEGDADAIIEKRGLKQISDAGAIEKIVDEVLAANPKQVANYLAGKEKAFNFLIGQAMKATKGNADPQQLNETLKRKLAG
jgi:aspartyl-tRNA(Asn)/glutamyl-tRNA(Gln) amidotransferase subunit B